MGRRYRFQPEEGGRRFQRYHPEAPTRDQIRTRLNALAKETKPTDALVLMLIGHGTYDGVDYKFNIPGPDLSGTELARCSTASPPPGNWWST